MTLLELVSSVNDKIHCRLRHLHCIAFTSILDSEGRWSNALPVAMCCASLAMGWRVTASATKVA